ENGYRFDGMNAKYKVEISGSDGNVVSTSLSEYQGDGTSWKWIPKGSVEAKANIGTLEGRIKRSDIGNGEPAIYILAQRADGKTGRSIVPFNKEMKGLALTQVGIAEEIIQPVADATLLTVNVRAYGKDVRLNTLTVRRTGGYNGPLNVKILDANNAELGTGSFSADARETTVSLNKAVSKDADLTFRIVADVTGIASNSIGLKVAGATADGTVKISGESRTVYVGTPSGIIIDGAFGDWAGIQGHEDPAGDVAMKATLPVNPNIDINATKHTNDTGNVYFYARVYGDRILAGLTQVYRGVVGGGAGQPQPVEEADVYDYLYINFTVSVLGKEYSIQVVGKDGEVLSKKVLEKDILAMVWWSENTELSARLTVACGAGELELGIPFADGQITTYTVTMSDWIGKDTSSVIFSYHESTRASQEIQPKGTPHAPIHINGNSQFTRANGVGETIFVEDFESGDLNNWTIEVWGNVPYSVTTADHHSGTHALSLGPSTCPASAGDNYRVELTLNSPILPLPAGTYIFEYWRHEPCDWGGKMFFYINGEEAGWDLGPTCNSHSNSEWYYSYFGYSGGPITTIKLKESDITSSQTIYFDDFKIIRIGDVSASPNIIHINGNSDFETQAQTHGWTGNGTRENPYIIENYVIDAHGNYYGIFIENTDVWFVIRNCHIYNATSSGTIPYGAGIGLRNVSNGTVKNNICHNSRYGILLIQGCRNNIIHGNTLYANLWGVNLESDPLPIINNVNTTITCNIIQENYYGIFLHCAIDNIIASNWICNNTDYGVYVNKGEFNTANGNKIHPNNFIGNKGVSKGAEDRSQGYDNSGANYWYDNTVQEGNYWSNWDGNGWGSSNAYPIDGGTASDWYPLPRAGFHQPIHITGNAEFTLANGVTGGSGTQDDPYIIEGWDIDANGGSYCIWIDNTTAYFVIRNCRVYNATHSGSAPYRAGIALDNVTHGTLENNNASGNYDGVLLVSSSNNNITNNKVFGNYFGIYLYSSSNNNITNNNASGNIHEGIYLGESTNNIVTNNNVSSNSHGISLFYSSSNNNITNNNASSNSDTGICLVSSSNNNIINNTATGNIHEGIYLDSSSNNNITNNNASGNSDTGIMLVSSSNNNITYNWICNNANYGVYITGGSTGNHIHHNYFIANNGAGKGLSGNCQAYDSVGGNYWYDNTVQEGNYWSNWDGNGWGSSNAYPIDGGAGASDWYPLLSPVSEFLLSNAIAILAVLIPLGIARKGKGGKGL
ncbi:MAG: NosD domain-containing protein, partial [Thermoplasmata archaeon]